MSSRPKFYYLTPVTGLPATGPIQLGSIVSEPAQVTSPINDSPVPPASSAERVFTWDTTNEDVSIMTTSSGSLGIFAEFLAQLGAPLSGNISGEVSGTSSENWLFPKLSTIWFTPSADYVRSALRDIDVQNWLHDNKPWLPFVATKLYMVTGVKIAYGSQSTISTLKNKAGSLRIGFDFSSLGAPIKAGPEGEIKRETGITQTSTGFSPFVFAFRLQRIKVSALGDFTAEDYNKKALLSLKPNDDEEPEVELVIDGLEDDDAEAGEFGVQADEMKAIECGDEAFEGAPCKIAKAR